MITQELIRIVLDNGNNAIMSPTVLRSATVIIYDTKLCINYNNDNINRIVELIGILNKIFSKQCLFDKDTDQWDFWKGFVKEEWEALL